uniref:Uncharacterized protein n=1 Tax=Arundo donax TaxID=35708 RepID=A0A0A9B9X6_ARUDO
MNLSELDQVNNRACMPVAEHLQVPENKCTPISMLEIE